MIEHLIMHASVLIQAGFCQQPSIQKICNGCYPIGMQILIQPVLR